MLKIYHYPSCRKSRAGLQYLKDSGVDFEVVEYMKNLLTEEELEALTVKLNLPPCKLFRTQEADYKKFMKGKRFKDHECIRIMAQNPKLIRRPIIEDKHKAVVGDPAEEIAKLPGFTRRTADGEHSNQK
jgi:arsenate reductase